VQPLVAIQVAFPGADSSEMPARGRPPSMKRFFMGIPFCSRTYGTDKHGFINFFALSVFIRENP
jgi:hypothetical protein